MAFDYSQLHWTPTQAFSPPSESQLARSLNADAGNYAEYKFAPTAQNLALLQSLGYGGQGFVDAGPDYGFGSAPGWSDEARNWLSSNGYNLGVAHDPGTTPGGRAEYFGLTGPDGKYVSGQSDPTMTISDTLMEQITPFLMMAGPFLGAAGVIGSTAGAGAGMAGIAADGVSLGSAGIGGASAAGGAAGAAGAGAAGGFGGAAEMTADQLFQQAAQQALETSGNYYMQSLPAQLAMDAGNVAALTEAGGTGAGGGLLEAGNPGGNSLVQQQTNIWDKLQNGAQKGAIKGGVSSAIKGENPLKGAAMGAIGGAIGGGISSIGDGSLGNAMSLNNSNNMDLIPGGFDGFEPGPTDGGGALGSLGSLGSTTGTNMNWADLFGGAGSVYMGGDSGGSTDPWDEATQAALQGSGNYYTQSPWDQAAIDAGNISGVGDIGSGSSGWDWGSILNGVKSGVGAISGAVGGGGNLAALIGAGLGATQGGKTETSSRDPWAAAQPYLKNLLADAETQRANLAANPFTPQQTQAYSNAYAGLDQARSALPGLLNWGQQAMQRQSTTPSYASLFGGAQPAQPAQPPQLPTMQAGGPGGLLDSPAIKNMMVRGRGLIG